MATKEIERKTVRRLEPRRVREPSRPRGSRVVRGEVIGSRTETPPRKTRTPRETPKRPARETSPRKPASNPAQRKGKKTIGPKIPGKLASGPAGKALMAEFLVALVIVAVRAIADYVPLVSGTEPGTEKPPKGQSPPLVVLGGVLGVFFVLSFAANASVVIRRAAVTFGLLIDIALLLKSSVQFEQISGWAENFGGQAKSSKTKSSGSSGSSGGSSGSSKSGSGSTTPHYPGNPQPLSGTEAI